MGLPSFSTAIGFRIGSKSDVVVMLLIAMPSPVRVMLSSPAYDCVALAFLVTSMSTPLADDDSRENPYQPPQDVGQEGYDPIRTFGPRRR